MSTASITVVRGDTYINEVTITDQDGAAYNLTGADVWLTVKERTDDADDDLGALIQLEIGSGLVVSTPASGVVAVTISDDETATLTAGRSYRYDVQVRKSGQTFTPISGLLTVAPDVTRT